MPKRHLVEVGNETVEARHYESASEIPNTMQPRLLGTVTDALGSVSNAITGIVGAVLSPVLDPISDIIPAASFAIGFVSGFIVCRIL